jgi:hypothetical protein
VRQTQLVAQINEPACDPSGIPRLRAIKNVREQVRIIDQPSSTGECSFLLASDDSTNGLGGLLADGDGAEPRLRLGCVGLDDTGQPDGQCALDAHGRPLGVPEAERRMAKSGDLSPPVPRSGRDPQIGVPVRVHALGFGQDRLGLCR